ncbi:hypothetical protein [Caldovatus aquaticus]|uniref:Uncharacterized protein n=1 Tax=Caldovatus aquaticus TaxID=2865671 RepID=A0ABS7F1C9_9PROT|nr:hypothetical protein [Caldovatus aquaticus]MBW8269435.1 hypothetical protein [Caldovatus aquaticus]
MATAPSRPADTPSADRNVTPGTGRLAAGTNRGTALRELVLRRAAVRVARERNLAAGPPPDDAEVARMVAEFLARGGQVTRCATAHLAPVHNGAGREARDWTL